MASQYDQYISSSFIVCPETSVLLFSSNYEEGYYNCTDANTYIHEFLQNESTSCTTDDMEATKAVFQHLGMYDDILQFIYSFVKFVYLCTFMYLCDLFIYLFVCLFVSIYIYFSLFQFFD